MPSLDYTAVTTGGDAFDIRFPLHDETRSADAVARMLSAVLEALSREVETDGNTSDGDVLQALSMGLAVRARLVDVQPSVTLRLMHELVDNAFAATLKADRYRAARA
jgi:hypothetical protein